MVLSNTHVGFLRFLPKYVLGTRNIYWVYVLGNTPCVLDNTFLYVLGNTDVLQDIYPIHMLCDPIYIDVIQHIYPIHIFIYIGVRICLGEHLFICIGQQRYVLDNNDMYWVYVLGDIEYVLDIYIGQPHPIHIPNIYVCYVIHIPNTY